MLPIQKIQRKFRAFVKNNTIALYLFIAVSLVAIYAIIFMYLMYRESIYIPAQAVNIDPATAIYWVSSTMTTVGYGDVVFMKTVGLIFSVIVQISGVIMIFSMMFPLVITPWLEKRIQSQLPLIAPKNLSDHIIICGYNPMIETLAEEFKDHNIAFIIVDSDESTVQKLVGQEISCMYGDSSDIFVLKHANITKSKMLIANESDELNATIVLTVRDFSQELSIIAIVEDLKKAKYLHYAGATQVISPKSLLGNFIGKKAIDPMTHNLTGAKEFFEGLLIIELPIYPASQLIKKSLLTAQIRGKTGAHVVGMWIGGELMLHPPPSTVIKSNSVLLAVGSDAQLSMLRELTR